LRVSDLPTLLDEYIDFVFDEDPIAASDLGDYRYSDRLGTTAPDALAERRQRRETFRYAFDAVEREGLTATERLDLDVAIADVATAIRRDSQIRWPERAAYWYPEQLGRALDVPVSRRYAPADERGEQLLDRLRQAPQWLADGRCTLGHDIPELWRSFALSASNGVTSFLSTAVKPFTDQLRSTLGAEVAAAADGVLAALDAFVVDIAGRSLDPDSRWAGGGEYVDGILRELHGLDLDHRQLAEFGRSRLGDDRARLQSFAASIDTGRTWGEQIDRIKDRHPAPDEFIEVYRHEMMRARDHTAAASLATLPEGEECRMAWVPEFLRSSLPIAVMHTTPPFEDGLISEWWITPSDLAAPADRRLQQQRDNCYVFAESIAGHEIYPGHHLQKVHHKLATADSRIRRYFSSPLFVEGWGLYVEDLFEETGFFDNADVLLFKYRNAAWRSVRVVIDVGLHTGSLSFHEAVDLLVREAGMDLHMAEGEVNRYCRHDNATYQSSYLLGKTAIQELRETERSRLGDAFRLGEFHDRVMSFGSIPVSLIAEQMASRPTQPASQPTDPGGRAPT
jgi:uncharacterized protein (DUF885 family)